MNASKIIAAVGFSLLAVAGVQAETYDGVHVMNSTKSRAEMAAEGAAAAQAGNQYAEGASAGAQTFNSTADPEKIHADAVAKAHDPMASLDRRAFYRDQPPATYGQPKMTFGRREAQASR